MNNYIERDALIEQVVQYGVLYYIIPEGTSDLSEDDLEQINASNNYSTIDLVGKLKEYNIDNNTNLFQLFAGMVCDKDGFGTYGFISEFAIELVAEVLNINTEDFEQLVMDFLDEEENEEKITISDFIELAKQIDKDHYGLSKN